MNLQNQEALSILRLNLHVYQTGICIIKRKNLFCARNSSEQLFSHVPEDLTQKNDTLL